MRVSSRMIAIHVVIIVLGILIAMPNILSPAILSSLPTWVSRTQVALGLDLKGGSHLILEVDTAALLKERMQTLVQDSRKALRDAKVVGVSVRSSQDQILFAFSRPEQAGATVAVAKSVLSAFSSENASGDGEYKVTSDGSNVIRIAITESGQARNVNAAVEQSLEIIRQRVDQVGVSEPTIQRVGSNRILVQLPGTQDPSRLRQLLGSTAKMSFHMLVGSNEPGVTTLKDERGNQYPVRDRPDLSGDRLTDARAGFDQSTGQAVVNFRFDSTGAAQFAAITQANIGRPFAIVMDGKVLSAPVIREPITGGSGQISGNFTVEAASTLSAMLRAGALPAKLTVIEERTVGADLGADSIRMGLYTGLAGFALVFGLMVVLYGAWGLLANLALLLNIILTFAGLSLLGATLTLPGIAGIVLGVGLAVDANVLINERIREETRKGRSTFAAIDNGFKRAYSTIVDSNVTALISTLLLFWFGNGPVRGFAVTMGLGIAISMFTAVTVVRTAMVLIAGRYKLRTVDIQPLFPFRLIPEGTKIHFMRARILGVVLSAFLSVASVLLMISPGLNYGVDFKGGIQMELSTKNPVDLAKFREGFGRLGLGEVTLQEISGSNRVIVRVEQQAGGEEEQALAITQLKSEALALEPSSKIERTEVVGPKVSGELATAGILAVVFASLGMLGYIWIRFEWPFAVGAIATLALDVTKTAGFFALTGLEFNLTAIAALLTLVGYSVNDKVVVYDRMRENLRLYKTMSLRQVIDLSINETLARSIYTSLTALFAILPMALWGGNAVQSFAVPMVFGISIAASSSIFIAAPILLSLGDWRNSRRHHGVPLV